MDDKIALAGDWHGAYPWTRGALKTLGETGVKQIFHAGDFGLGWPGKWPDMINLCEKICKQYDMELYVTPGNHENWDWINSREYDENDLHQMTAHTFLMKRSAVVELAHRRKLLSLGGAISVDRTIRTQGISYWAEEAITLGDLYRLQDVKDATGDVDIMIMHDAPDGGTDAVQRIMDIPPHLSIFPTEGIIASGEHRDIVDRAVEIVNPKVFVHGHFHAPDFKITNERTFVSLGCNEQPDNLALLDLKDLSVEFLPLDERFIR